MPTDNGYSNQKKKGLAQFETIHNVGSSSFAKHVAPKALYEITPSTTLNSVTDIIGSNGQVEFWNIEYVSHAASVGNVLRITDQDLINFEFEIVKVIDVDNFYVLPISETQPDASYSGAILGWVTQKVSSDGSSTVSITSPPTQFNYDGAPQTVEQDTVTAANNRALPNLNFIIKDGVQIPISKDTGTPANTVGMPVEIVAASGTPINITAGDLNVQLTDLGANFDASRTGDGTGNYLDIAVHQNAAKANGIQIQAERMSDATLSSASPRGTEGDSLRILTDDFGQIRTYDQFSYEELTNFSSNFNTRTPTSLGRKAAASSFATALSSEDLAVLTSIDTKLSGNLSVADAQALLELQAINGKLPANLTVSSTRLLVDGSGVIQPVSASSLPLPTGAATEAKQDAEAILIGSTAEVAPANDTAVSGLNGRLQRIAQRITSLIALLPAALGQTTSANSLAVTIASDQSAVPVTQTALTASYQEDLTVTDASAETFTAPVGAKWCKIQADDTNTGNMRVKIGGTATTTSGIQFQPGRSEDYSAVGNISYIMEAGFTGKIYVQFGA